MTKQATDVKKPRRPEANPSDPYLAKLVTYIPTEVIAAYVAISGFIKSIPTPEQFTWFWVVSGILLFITPLWILNSAAITGKPRPIVQAIAAFFAFAAWVFATGGPFNQFLANEKTGAGWYHPPMGSIVLVLVCLCLPLIERIFPTPD